jgi:hypothetical protein
MDVNDFKDQDTRRKALEKLDHKTLVLLTVDWAYSVLPIYEAEYPKDNRPRKAIEAAEQWVSSHNISSSVVVQAAGDAAWAAWAAGNASMAAAWAAWAAGNASMAAAWDTNAAASAAANAAANAAWTAAWSAAYTAAYTAWDTARATGDAASKWEWLYKTYLQAVGPENKTFNDNWLTPTVKSLLYDTTLTPIINDNWLTPTVKSLLYDTTLTPIMADALEDAGCDNNDILYHLRDNKEWIRADWVLRRLTYEH